MVEVKPQISFQHFTNLPVREIAKTDGEGIAIEVLTPHKAVVVLNYKERSHSMFGAARTIDVVASSIIKSLSQLEREAKEHLFAEWKKTI